MILLSERNWIFDLDGTLTVGVHDFDELRKRMGIESSRPILESINEAPPAESARLARVVEEWEWELAECAEPANGAHDLLSGLRASGCRLGILTRNLKSIGLRTLQVAGLESYFDSTYVLGREEAVPKPDPAGIEYFLRAWGVSPIDSVMFGDYVFDIQAGRRAGVKTVLVGPENLEWAEWSDHQIRSLSDIGPAKV